jgi:hypothetical protein
MDVASASASSATIIPVEQSPRWVRFVAGARSARVHFPARCAETRFSVGFDWVRFARRVCAWRCARHCGTRRWLGSFGKFWEVADPPACGVAEQNAQALDSQAALVREAASGRQDIVRLLRSGPPASFGRGSGRRDAPTYGWIVRRFDGSRARQNRRISKKPRKTLEINLQNRPIVATPFARAASNRRKWTYGDDRGFRQRRPGFVRAERRTGARFDDQGAAPSGSGASTVLAGEGIARRASGHQEGQGMQMFFRFRSLLNCER